jgi:alkylation response protein AidB-like acyl-CoA dehydrogenase
MDFDFSEEQSLLKDSFSRFIKDNYDPESRRRLAASERGFSVEHWRRFAELGWLSLPFDEEHGGLGGGIVPILLLSEEFGKGLVLEPYLPTVVLFGGLLRRTAQTELQKALLAKVIGGSLQGAFAYHERQSRYELADVRTTLNPTAAGFVLNGEKTVVFNGAAADQLVVSARSHGGQYDRDGISLVVVDANAAGVAKTKFRLMDGQIVANITLTNVAVSEEQILGKIGEGFGLLQSVISEATLVISAEALGIMQSLNDATLQYAKIRKQFGATIGSFQALQHRLVDMFSACEQTRSLLYRAICSLQERGLEANTDIIALKAMVGKAGKLIGGEAIQLHGGMGITDELVIGHYAKRLMIINTSFGDADYQRQQFASHSYVGAT